MRAPRSILLGRAARPTRSEVVQVGGPNTPSRGVAEKLGMHVEQETEVHGRHVVVYGRGA